MLYMTTSDDRYAFDFTYPTPDDELHNRLSPSARKTGRRMVGADGHVQCRCTAVCAPRERSAPAQRAGA